MGKKAFSVKLTDILIEHKAITPEALATAEEEAKTAGARLESYLMEKKLVPSAEMVLALSEYLNMSPISLAHFVPDAHLIELIPRETLLQHKLIPVTKTGKSLTVALSDPFDIIALDKLHTLTNLDIIPLVATEKDVTDILSKSFAADANTLNMQEIMNEAESDVEVGTTTQEDQSDKVSLEEMMKNASDSPVIRLVNMIIIEALRLRASDIMIEPQEDFVRLRYRIDGVVVERPNLQLSLKNAIISRIKIMADMDIGETRLPQGGRFRITALGKKIDVRVSVLPIIFGGRVVMRLIDKNALFPNLAALNLDENSYRGLSYAIAQPHGIILVTGPTGSGKTTTLYSCLQELNKVDVNISTCEDPVEYRLPRVNQVQINTDVGLTFAASLRALLRQDPDIILIGEIRDAETCDIAIRAALTGHLVLSTLHANDAAGAVTRLLDMGVEPFLMATSVILSQAQRLFRKLCPVCKKEVSTPVDLLKEHGIDPQVFDGATLFGPQGCPKCFNIGYKGRAAVMEVLTVDETIRGAILRHAIAEEIRDLAEKNGMVTLRTATLMKVKDGTTSIETALKMISL